MIEKPGGRKARIVFLGSPATAAEILEYILRQGLANVVAVWTSPAKRRSRSAKPAPSPVAIVAKQYNIAIRECVKIDEDEIRCLQSLQVDLGLVIAFGVILPKAFFQVPSLGMVNLHFSLLPKYRGASPIQAAILNGDKETGISLQKIKYKLDTGDVLLSQKFSLDGLFGYFQVLERATELAKPLLQSFFTRYQSMLTQPLQAQDESRASYCYKIKTEDGWIREESSAISIHRMIQAYYPWPGVYFYIHDEKYSLHGMAEPSKEAVIYAEEKGIRSAALFTLEKRAKKLFLYVKKSTVIEVKTLQKPGRKMVSSLDFLNASEIDFPVELRLKK